MKMAHNFDDPHPGPTEPQPDELPVDALPPGGPSSDDEYPDDTSSKERRTERTVVYDIARERFELGVDTAGQVFGVDRQGPRVACSLRGGRLGLRSALSAAYRAETGKVPGAAALADALTALEGEAAETNPVDVALRVGRTPDGAIVVDLGTASGEAVVIGPGGWEVVASSPILFRRSNLTMPLPRPECVGDGQALALLRDSHILNLSEGDWPLLVAWLVAAFVPDVPHPIPFLVGEQGVGKTTAARTIARLVDPSAAPVRSVPRHEDQWATSAAASWVCAIDNVSSLSEWFSDALCRAVTGDGWLKRQLYSDGDVAVLAFRRCIVLTSIDAGSLRGDLAERLLPLELERIDPTRRRTEAELESAFQASHPAIFGALLSLLARVLEVLPSIQLDELPRMADFARIVAAVDEVLGTDALAAYLNVGSEIAADVIEGDDVARAIVALVEREGAWRGTAAQLLREITPDDRLPKGWPTQANVLSGMVKRLAPALRSVGVAADRATGRERRVWVLQRCEHGSESPSPSSPPSQRPELRPPA